MEERTEPEEKNISEDQTSEENISKEDEKQKGLLKADLSIKNRLDCTMTLDSDRQYKITFPDKWNIKEARDVLIALAKFFEEQEAQDNKQEEETPTVEKIVD